MGNKVEGTRRLEYLPLNELVDAKQNPKLHTEDIPVSIGRFGYVEPMILDERTGRLVAGHGRKDALLAMAKAGVAEAPEGIMVAADGRWLAPVIRGWSSKDDDEAAAYLIASNRLTEQGGWDDKTLCRMLGELDAAGALLGVGFERGALEELMAKFTEDNNPPAKEEKSGPRETPAGVDDVPEPPADCYVKPGEVYQLGTHRIHCGDSRDVVGSLPEASVHACVTDPPYEIGFMGKGWDASGVAYDGKLWGPVLRALPPGGHLLAFGATRTYHRMAVAIEDAGAEIRDTVLWLYGTGFPKSLNVSKEIDSKAGAKRKVVEKATVPATAAAKQWNGWGSALKPACEPCVMARKPLAGTLIENVRAHETGALNIDGCRIAGGPSSGGTKGSNTALGLMNDDGWKGRERVIDRSMSAGRWPANVLLDEDAAAELDAQSGESTSPPVGSVAKVKRIPDGRTVSLPPMDRPNGYGDRGGASRFFYVAKPARSERDAGLEGAEEHSRAEMTGRKEGSKGSKHARAGAGGANARNHHPTVKPVDLMRHLVRLVTPPKGRVLEPFSGSGTTLLACELEGVACTAVEREPAYVQLAIARWEGMTKQKAVRIVPPAAEVRDGEGE